MDKDRFAELMDAQNNWPLLRKLLLPAEDSDFTPDQSAQLGPAFLGLAVMFRGSSDPRDTTAVLSMIRTGASMLQPDQAECLLPLLEPGHRIETSFVAIKMLGRIFEAQPPEELNQHTEMSHVVRGIAESLYNGCTVADSQCPAMLQLAVYTLVAMASSDALPVARAVRQIGVVWLLQQTVYELRTLRNVWEDQTPTVAPEVLKGLDGVVDVLEV